MAASFRQLAHYLHDCHRADNRELALLDIFASKVEYRQVRRTGDLQFFHAAAERNITFDDDLEKVARQAALHHGEKSLLGGEIFLVGQLLEGEKKRRICAPLYLAPLMWDGSRGRLRVDTAKWRLNVPLLEAVATASAKEPEDLDRWLDLWPAPESGLEAVRKAARTWAGDFPENVTDRLDTEFRDGFDEGIPEARLARLRLRRRTFNGGLSFELVRAEAIFLVRRSVDSRGVLSELERLAEASPSEPLRRLLRPDAPAASTGTRPVRKELLAPAILSPAQAGVVAAAVDEELSLVIGPPGTGKSFTIAAIALDALARGRSVLVSSKMNHAVDVVGDKLEALLGLGDVAVRGGRREYGKELRQRLERWLAGNLPWPGGDKGEALFKAFGEGALKSAESKVMDELSELYSRLERLEETLEERSQDEQRWGELFEQEADDAWWRRWLARVSRRHLTGQLDKKDAYWQQMEEYRLAQNERLEGLRHLLQIRFIKRLVKVLTNRRRELTRLRDAVRARTVSRREGLWQKIDQETLLEALPIWLVRLSDLAAVLPMQRQLFDLVIIDEATQCDLASSLPALFRAKRAVIVGDPKQLRHLCFLPRRRQVQIARRHGLGEAWAERFDYRDRSILDVVDSSVSSQRAVAFLDEHFRSAPSIIEFSNQEYYHSRLRVMQESPSHDWHRALYLKVVEGQRDEEGANRAEAEALIEDLRERVRAERNRPADLRHSIGVLSPFRAQVDLITELLAEALPPGAAEMHDLRVGTAHAFQGEERDFMYLSLALDEQSHPSAFRFLERPDVFNVSVTRARSIQVVYTSLDPNPLDANKVPGSGLLRRFLDHMLQDRSSPVPGPIDDSFAGELAERLRLEGCRVWAPYPVAGFEVDVVAELRGRSLGIDLVGCVGEYSGSFDIERYRLFNRAGLPLMPLPYSAWKADPARCIAALLKRLKNTSN